MDKEYHWTRIEFSVPGPGEKYALRFSGKNDEGVAVTGEADIDQIEGATWSDVARELVYRYGCDVEVKMPTGQDPRSVLFQRGG